MAPGDTGGASQAANLWLEGMKAQLRRAAYLNPDSDIRVTGLDLSAAADAVNAITSAVAEVYGFAGRNRDSARRFFQVFGDTAANVTPGTTAPPMQAYAEARVSATQASYVFAGYAAPMVPTTTNGLSAFASTAASGGTAITTGTIWLVYRV
jgi:hypothetical protein